MPRESQDGLEFPVERETPDFLAALEIRVKTVKRDPEGHQAQLVCQDPKETMAALVQGENPAGEERQEPRERLVHPDDEEKREIEERTVSLELPETEEVMGVLERRVIPASPDEVACQELVVNQALLGDRDCREARETEVKTVRMLWDYPEKRVLLEFLEEMVERVTRVDLVEMELLEKEGLLVLVARLD